MKTVIKANSFKIRKTFIYKSLLSVVSCFILFAFLFSSSTNAESVGFITELDINSNNSPSFITTDKDGNIWAILNGKIGRITPTGTLTEFTLPPVFWSLQRITSGPDGNVWFTDYVGNKIGKLTPDGTVTEYALPQDSYPIGITAGPDGNVWFIEYIGSNVGRITPDGVITKFHVSYGPHDITTGPDGNLWYTVFGSNMIGRITPNGVVTEFKLPPSTLRSNPESITSGPDGNIWFTETGGNEIGKITPNGTITEYTIPTPDSIPYDIIAGADGNLWFTEFQGKKIGRITPNGSINEFQIPTSDSVPIGITRGSDDTVWFAVGNTKKLGRINLSSIPLLTPIPTATIVPTSTPTPTPQMMLSDYKQTDPQWAIQRLDNSQNCGTLYGFGCAMTSVANVFYSYGKTLLSSSQLNPGTLNNWLSSNNGYSSCGIIWANASPAVKLGAPSILFRRGNNEWTVGEQAIDNALNEGNLPIVGIKTNNNSAGTHFFVVSSKLPNVNGKPDYKIVDPALYPFVANNPGNTGKALSQTYGGFDSVFETVIYKKGTSPQKTLSIRVHSPVQLLITDPLGNQTGFSEETQSINEDIPDSVYGIESGIAPVDGSLQPQGDTKYFQQINPNEGAYAVQLIGTGNGSYSLDISKTDEEGNVSTEIIDGFAQQGVTETYQMEYTNDATEKPVILKEVTFDVLKSDINSLHTQGKIKNKIVYNTLKLQALLAERAMQMNRQPLGSKLAVLALRSFQYELKKVRGKSITEDAYQILYNDAKLLIQRLQNDSGGSEPTPTPQSGGS